MAFRAQRYTADQWEKLVSDFNRSDETVQGYCERHELGFSTFNRWRRRFSTATAGVNKSPRNGFVEAVPATGEVPLVTLHIGQSIRLSLPCSVGAEVIADLTQAVATRVGE